MIVSELSHVNTCVRFNFLLPIGQVFIKNLDSILTQRLPETKVLDAIPEAVPGRMFPMPPTMIADAVQFRLSDSLQFIVQREMMTLNWEKVPTNSDSNEYPGHEAIFLELTQLQADVMTAFHLIIDAHPNHGVSGVAITYTNRITTDKPPVPKSWNGENDSFYNSVKGKKCLINFNVSEEPNLDVGFQLADILDTSGEITDPRQWIMRLSAGRASESEVFPLNESLEIVHRGIHKMLESYFSSDLILAIIQENSVQI